MAPALPWKNTNKMAQLKKKTNKERKDDEEMGNGEQDNDSVIQVERDEEIDDEPPARRTGDRLEQPQKKTNKERKDEEMGGGELDNDSVIQVERDEETDESTTRRKRGRPSKDKGDDDKRLQNGNTKTIKKRNDNKEMVDGDALSTNGIHLWSRSDKCLAIFLDPGNSNTVSASVRGEENLRHMENWGHGIPQKEIPTLVVVSSDEKGQLHREFGLNARFARGTATAVFDRLKWNMLHSSSYIEKQQEDENATGYNENMKFFIQSTLKATMDNAIDPDDLPEEVLLYLAYPVEWDAVTVNKYFSYAELPSEWRGKFKFKIIAYNEATAAAIGKLSTMSQSTIEKFGLLEGNNMVVVDIGKGTTVRFPDYSTVHYMLINK